MAYLWVYVSGVVVALAAMRDPWRARLGTALLWPLGPLAFVVVLSVLAVASAILWPLPVLGTAGALGLAAWLLW